MKTLSIVIVNYNVKHFLEQALLSVRKAIQGIEAEVFVVDNNSVDGSIEMVRKKFPEVTLIASKKNLGFSKGNNVAIQQATGKYVLLLNPDTIVQEDTFHKCIQFMDEHPDAGALGVKMINGVGEFLAESKRSLPTPWVAFYKIFGLASIFPQSKRFGKYHLTYLDKDQNHEVEVLSGAYMFIRKSVLDEIGLLDEDYFMYGEDIDLSYRVTQTGLKNYYFADTQIVHYKGESTKKGSLNYVIVFYNAMLIFAKKHFSKGNQSLFMLLIQSAIYFRAGLSVAKRIYHALAFPTLEFLLIFLLSLGVKGVWERNIFLAEFGGHAYPEEFNTIAAPIYALIFTSLLMISGAYKKPYPLRPLFTSAFIGFITIATISFIFKQINFSRGIVALVSSGTLLLTLATRAISNYFHSGHIFFDRKFNKKTIILGNIKEAERIKNLIHNDLSYDCELTGIITDDEQETGPQVLGSSEQLFEIIHFYKIEEIIFCNDTFSTRQIIQIMGQLHEQKVSFKIVPKDADYLIGPNFIYVSSPHTGLIFSNLAKPESHYKKLFFDFVVSSGILLLFPLIFWVFEKPSEAWKNTWKVWKGNYHLVGYIDGSSPDLPMLKHGLLDMSLLRQTREEEYKQLDRQYARHYSWGLDLQILLKGFRKIGQSLS